jgi:hypothetical protein
MALPDRIDELLLAESHWEDHFMKPPALGKSPDNFFRNVVFKVTVRTKAVNEDAPCGLPVLSQHKMYPYVA